MFQKRRNLQYSQSVVNTACKKLVAAPRLLLTKILFLTPMFQKRCLEKVQNFKTFLDRNEYHVRETFKLELPCFYSMTIADLEHLVRQKLGKRAAPNGSAQLTMSKGSVGDELTPWDVHDRPVPLREYRIQPGSTLHVRIKLGPDLFSLRMPDEIVLQLCNSLRLGDVISLSQSCKRFCNIICTAAEFIPRVPLPTNLSARPRKKGELFDV